MAYRPTPAGPRTIRELFHWLWRELTKVGDAIEGGGGGGGVTKIIAGTNITISPTTGVGDVTINSTGGGGGDSGSEVIVVQPSAGFDVGDAVTQNGTTIALANANNENTLALGIVSRIIDANSFAYIMSGEVTAPAHGLTVDQYYYLSDVVPGALTPTEPTISQPLVYANTADTFIVYPYRPSVGGLPPVFSGAGTTGYVPDPGVELGYVLSDSGDWVAGGTGGGGQSNTSSNQGGGFELALAKVGVDLPFRTLVAGDNITIDLGSDTLTLNSVGGGGGDQFNIDGGRADSIYEPPATIDGGGAAG